MPAFINSILVARDLGSSRVIRLDPYLEMPNPVVGCVCAADGGDCEFAFWRACLRL